MKRSNWELGFRLDHFFYPRSSQINASKISLDNPPSGCRILSNDLRLLQRVKDELGRVENGERGGGGWNSLYVWVVWNGPTRIVIVMDHSQKYSVKIALFGYNLCTREKFSNKSQNKWTALKLPPPLLLK